MRTSQQESGEVTAGLVTRSWTTRLEMHWPGGESQTVTRSLTNHGSHYSVSRTLGEPGPAQDRRETESRVKKGGRERPGTSVEPADRTGESEPDLQIPAESLNNFLSTPATTVLQKLLAQQRSTASLQQLRTINDAGEILAVSCCSRPAQDGTIEMVRRVELPAGPNISTTTLDSNGDVLSCCLAGERWEREGPVAHQAASHLNSLVELVSVLVQKWITYY